MLEVLSQWQSAVHEPMDQGNMFNVDGPGLEELLAYMNQQNGPEEQPAFPSLFGGQMDISALGLQLQPHLPDSSPSTTSSDDTPSLFNSMGSTGIPTTDVTTQQHGGLKADANGNGHAMVYANTATSQLQQPTVKSEDPNGFAVFSPPTLPNATSIDTPMVSQAPHHPTHPPPHAPLHLGAPGLLHSTVPLGSSTSNLLSLGAPPHPTQPPPGVLFPGASHSAPFPAASSLMMLNSAPMPTSLPAPHPILLSASNPPSLPHHPLPAPLPRPSSTPLPPMGSQQQQQKTHISHSSVEKQRRDRINSLLEELGDLIEPSDPKYCGEGGAARRPKHVLLADAIKVVHALIASLSDVRHPDPKPAAAAAPAGAAAAADGGAAAPLPPLANGNGVLGMGDGGPGSASVSAAPSANGNVSGSSGGNGGSGGLRPIGYEEVVRTLNVLKLKAGLGEGGADGKSEDEGMSARGGGGTGTGEVNLPQAPEDAPRFHGVMVEQKAHNTFEVKVNCRDRRGLMLDIIAAMQNMQLVVTNATVTTKDNMVADIFEVGPGDDRAISSEEIQCSVWRALYNANATNKNRSSKRRMLLDS